MEVVAVNGEDTEAVGAGVDSPCACMRLMHHHNMHEPHASISFYGGVMNSSGKVRIRGCIHGLDSDTPTNPERVCHLPCQWRVNSVRDNSCFWKLVDRLAQKGEGLTLREIGSILNTTHETVRNTEASAMRKLRTLSESMDSFSDEDFEDIDYDVRDMKKKQTESAQRIIDMLSIDFFGEKDESDE